MRTLAPDSNLLVASIGTVRMQRENIHVPAVGEFGRARDLFCFANHVLQTSLYDFATNYVLWFVSVYKFNSQVGQGDYN